PRLRRGGDAAERNRQAEDGGASGAGGAVGQEGGRRDDDDGRRQRSPPPANIRGQVELVALRLVRRSTNRGPSKAGRVALIPLVALQKLDGAHEGIVELGIGAFDPQ